MTLLEEKNGNESLIIGQWFGNRPLSAIYELGAGQEFHFHETGGQNCDSSDLLRNSCGTKLMHLSQSMLGTHS